MLSWMRKEGRSYGMAWRMVSRIRGTAWRNSKTRPSRKNIGLEKKRIAGVWLAEEEDILNG